MINIIYGTRHGLAAPGNAAWSQASPGVPGKAQPFDAFGTLGTR